MIVTHDPEIARHTHRIVRMQDGLIVDDEVVTSPRWLLDEEPAAANS
ncbi:MAG: hypothetical protein ACUVWB_04290 [Anaerolineae bacterium]